MTANAVLNPFPPGPPREPPAGVATVVRLIRESFAAVEPQADEVACHFYATLFSLAPNMRELFPINMQVQRSRLLRALIHIVQTVDRPEELVPFLRQLGRDHRKFGVVTGHFEAFGTALLASIKAFAGAAWTPEVERAWAEAYTIVARTMQEAAAADEGPAWWNGTVTDHQRIGSDLAIVRVRADHPVPYRAGQYVSVEVPQRPRLWRYLSPANAPGEHGLLEFHVRAVDGGVVSRAIVSHTQVGDTWRIGPPMGRMGVDRQEGQDVLMVAGGTGVAPMHAILDELAQWGENPRVHLFMGGRTRHDLYDFDNLHRLAMGSPWLTVVPVLESDPGAPSVEHGTLPAVVTRYGAWADRNVLVCGSPDMVRATVASMLDAGTPLNQIQYDPFPVD
jgi:NAD(P)H-flavin reductase/hemoglobin-like flavoprotein